MPEDPEDPSKNTASASIVHEAAKAAQTLAASAAQDRKIPAAKMAAAKMAATKPPDLTVAVPDQMTAAAEDIVSASEHEQEP